MEISCHNKPTNTKALLLHETRIEDCRTAEELKKVKEGKSMWKNERKIEKHKAAKKEGNGKSEVKLSLIEAISVCRKLWSISDYTVDCVYEIVRKKFSESCRTDSVVWRKISREHERSWVERETVANEWKNNSVYVLRRWINFCFFTLFYYWPCVLKITQLNVI